jgi:hypothetical protein
MGGQSAGVAHPISRVEFPKWFRVDGWFLGWLGSAAEEAALLAGANCFLRVVGTHSASCELQVAQAVDKAEYPKAACCC